MPKSPEWPTEINGKDVTGYVKDLSDPDPAVRDMALQFLPNFGPSARKVAGKAILRVMENENDPGVRLASYTAAATLQFDDDIDTKRAITILGNAADRGLNGGLTRRQAVDALGAFGPKAESAVPFLTGPAAQDTAYDTRRAVVITLGQIGYSEKNGPSTRALNVLTSQLINDSSAAVRLQAMQTLVLLGPPWDPAVKGTPPTMPGGPPVPPKVDEKAAAVHIAAIKKRLTLVSGKPVEADQQVEIWARVALIRFAPNDVKQFEEQLNVITKFLTGGDRGTRLHALTALRAMGPLADRKIDDIVKMLSSDDPATVGAAVDALVSMGQKAKPAIPELDKLKNRKGFEFLANEAIRLIKESPGATAPGMPPGGTPPKQPAPADPKKP